MKKILRIGTRDSKLALWQAREVQSRLDNINISSELVHIKSRGDLNQSDPLDQMGAIGIFTKALDEALLNEEIDVAVHSMKDVPTSLPDGIQQLAVLPRGPVLDVLISQEDPHLLLDKSHPLTIATGSLRRKAQWLNRFPNHNVIGIRGNVDSRLRKVETEDMDGTILAQAGLQRLAILPRNMMSLDWMIPAPAQGVVGIFGRVEDEDIAMKIVPINHFDAGIQSDAERQLLHRLEGGCTAPIGALARTTSSNIHLTACLLTPDGTKKVEDEIIAPLDSHGEVGAQLASKLLESGGAEIIDLIRSQ